MAFWTRRKSVKLAREPTQVPYKSIKIFNTDSRSDVLGIGTYGSVFRGQCDDFPCAVKILHPTFFEPTRKVSLKKFEQECEFLCSIRHPNILQYYGTHQDPKSGLPVLLMELLDTNLTKFLEEATEGIPFHMEVNLCHDVSLALSYLHSRNVLHQSLSSNNVLMIGNSRAKVSDFGMLKILGGLQRSPSGREVYMAPETLKVKPLYTDKMDIFSFGVLVIQVLTRKFPRPGVGSKSVHIEHPHFSNIDVGVSEAERRRNHINEIDPNHPLLPIALGCIKDKSIDRSNIQEVSSNIEAIKETDLYTESIQAKRITLRTMSEPNETTTVSPSPEKKEADPIRELEMELQSQSEHHSQEIDEYQQHYMESINSLQEVHAQEIHSFKRRYDEDVESLQQQRIQQVKTLQDLLKTQYHSLQEKNAIAATQVEEIQRLRQQLAAQEWKKEQTVVTWKLENQELKHELEATRQQLRSREKELRRRVAHLEQVMEQVKASEQEVSELKSQLYELEQLLLSESVHDETEHNVPKNGEDLV